MRYNIDMKNLHNALLLKQLYQLKNLGYKYTEITPYKEKEPNFTLPSTIEDLKRQASNCHLCELSKSRTKVVFGEGNIAADIMFIGGTPSQSDDQSGTIFTNKQGELLNNMIEKVLLIPTSSTYITNIVKCRALENSTPTSMQAHTCLPYVFKEIEIVKPKIVVTLGEFAYHYITGDDSSIDEIHGNTIKNNDYIVVPSIHPEYMLRNPSAKATAFADLKKIKTLLQSFQ